MAALGVIMNNEISLSLTKPMDEADLNQLDLFRIRFSELWSNWESLKDLGINLGGSFQNEGNGRLSGAGCGIETHRLKGFYLDFRFFVAAKEPTQYFKIAKKVSAHCQDSRLHQHLRQDRTSWHNAGVLQEWHGLKADDLINVIFNADLFHNAPDLQAQLSVIRESMTSDLAHHLLTFSIYNRMLVLRNLNWVIQPLTASNQFIRIPNQPA